MLESWIEPASSFAGDIDFLFWMITLIVGFWFLLVEFVIFYLLFKFRRQDGVKGQYITGETKTQAKFLSYPHALIIACDVLLIVYTVIGWNHIKQYLPEPEDKVRIIAQQWSWIFIHSGPDGKLDTADDISTVNGLHLKEGVTYHYDLQSRDVLHDFSVPVFRLKQDTIPGRAISGWFKPTKSGEWDVQCAEMCGIGHGLMAARVFVYSGDDYDKWMSSVSDEEALEGFAALRQQDERYIKQPFTQELAAHFEPMVSEKE